MEYALKSRPLSTHHERRRSRRWIVTLGLVADIGDGVTVHGYMFDVSRQGAYVVLETQAELGTRASLTFDLERVPSTPVASGSIVRVERYGRRTGIGIAFDDVSRAFRAFIGALDHSDDAQRLVSLRTIRLLCVQIR